MRGRSFGVYASSVANKGFKAALGNNGNAVSGTSLVITTTAAIAVGDLVVVRVAADNLTVSTPTIAVSDSGGNTYTQHRYQGNNGTGAALGVVSALLATKATTAIAAGGTITVTLGTAVTAKAAYAESFIGFNNTVRSTPVGAIGSTAAHGSGTSGTINAGDLVLGLDAAETRGVIIGDPTAANGTWSAIVTKPNATSGTDATCVTVAGQYVIPTASGAQTYDPSGTNGVDWATAIVVLQAAP